MGPRRPRAATRASPCRVRPIPSTVVRTIRIHDTASGALQELRPRVPGQVGIYACGPTVYNRIHVGNARPFVVYALLKRFLSTRATTSRSWPT